MTYLSWSQYFVSQDKDVDDDDALAIEERKYNISNLQTSTSMYGDLASWYLDYVNRTNPKEMKKFNRKIANSLAADGHFNDEELTETLTEFLCSPASRFDSPDPSKFLADLRNPRFTGEQASEHLNTSLTGHYAW